MACDAHSTSRRALLSGLVAIPTTLGTYPGIRLVAAAEANPDAALLDAGDRWVAAYEAYDSACAAHERLIKANPLPEAPDAIFFRDSDHDFCFHEHTTLRADGERWYFLDLGSHRGSRLRQPIKRAGAFRPPYGHPLHGKASMVSGMVPWVEAQARADEIVLAYDKWRADIQAMKASCGISDAEDLAGKLGHAIRDEERVIEAASAKTLGGLQVKARIARYDLDQDDEPSLALLKGMVADLLAMGAAA